MLKSLFKQSSIYFLGLATGKVISTITFILLARHLLSNGFGVLTLYITLLQVITFFGDFGLNQWYQKQADSEEKHLLFNKIIIVRVITLIISVLLGYAFYQYFNLPDHLVYVFLLTLIPEAFSSVIDGFYLEQKKPFTVSLKTISKTVILLATYVMYLHNFTVYSAIYTYSFACFATFLWYFPWRQLETFRFVSLNSIVNVIKESASYAFLIFTSFAYSRGDSLIIGYTMGNSALGIYGAAYRYLDSLSMIPTAVAHNLFHISAKKEGISLKHLLRITGFMTIIGLIFTIALYFSANVLTIYLLGKDYLNAMPLIQIFSLVVLLFFMNAAVSTVVQSSHLIHKFLPFGFINTVANLVLNLIFIPKFGLQAAAWIMLLTEITGLLINVYFVKRIYNEKN